MDHIRTAYECDVRFFPDQPDNVSRIRWYFADPDALPLPYRHRFGSRYWEQPVDGDGPVGELFPGSRRWYSGENFTGALGVGTSVPEVLWFTGCGVGDVLTGTECEAGFWESVRYGFGAFLSSLHP